MEEYAHGEILAPINIGYLPKLPEHVQQTGDAPIYKRARITFREVPWSRQLDDFVGLVVGESLDGKLILVQQPNFSSGRLLRIDKASIVGYERLPNHSWN